MAEILRRQRRRAVELNMAKRIPVCFLIDNSASMNDIYVEEGHFTKNGHTIKGDGVEAESVTGGVTKLDKVVDNVRKFRRAIYDNPQTRDSCEDCIVEFDEYTNIYQDFESMTEQRINAYNKRMATGNGTILSPALNRVLNILDERRKYYDDHNIPRNQPWLVILCDGNISEDLTLISDRLMEEQKLKHLTVYILKLDNKKESLEQLRCLSEQEPIDCSDPSKISNFFVYLTRSVSAGLNVKNYNNNEDYDEDI